MKRSILFLACVGACALLLTACGREKSFDAGTEMNAEEAKAYREKLLAEAAEADEAPEGDLNTAEGGHLPDVCYYTENGSVWHLSKDCSYLKKATNILEAPPESAELAGKARPCSRCASIYG